MSSSLSTREKPRSEVEGERPLQVTHAEHRCELHVRARGHLCPTLIGPASSPLVCEALR